MRFGKAQNANAKYRDPSFNDKRLWVSRLLAQLFLEDAVIISVDESNFRSDYLPTKQWSFNSAALHKESRGCDSSLTPAVGKTEVLVTDDVIQYAEMLAGYPNREPGMSTVTGVREQDQMKESDIALLQSQVLIHDERDLKLGNLRPQAMLGTSR